MSHPLVTLLIPCYNMEKKVHRLFDSILRQTYRKLQIIVINDGSTDRSEDIIKSYGKRFESAGFLFLYRKIKNSGVAKACETGLQYVEGEFLCWPDADDFYNADSIQKFLAFFEKNKDYSFVRSDAYIYLDSYIDSPVGKLSRNSITRDKEDLFLDFILEKGVYFAPICYMARFSSFKEVNPSLTLYDSPSGQNYQMLLPLAYKYKFGFIDECLCNYLIFQDSHSHSIRSSYSKILKRSVDKHDCVMETLKKIDMPPDEYERFRQVTDQKLIAEKCLAAFDWGKKSEYRMLRPLVTHDFYIQKLNHADKLFSVPFMFRIHHYSLNIKRLISDNIFLYRLAKFFFK